MQFDSETTRFSNSKHTHTHMCFNPKQRCPRIEFSFETSLTYLWNHHLPVKARAGQTIVTMNEYVKSLLYSENKVNIILNTLEIQTTCCCCFFSPTVVNLSSKHADLIYNCRSTKMSQLCFSAVFAA